MRSPCFLSLQKPSGQDLCKRPGKDLCNRSLRNVSVQGLHKRCPGKISDLYIQGLLAWLLYEISRLPRASTVEMHMDMSQTLILFWHLQEKCRTPEISRMFWAVEMHMDISRGPFYAENRRKMPDAPTATPVLCEPARSKCTWTCHESQEDFNAEISR